MANGDHAAAAAGHGLASANPASPAAFARRHHYNEKAAEYLAAAVCGTMAVFVLAHWTQAPVRALQMQLQLQRPVAAVARPVRRRLLHTMPGLTGLPSTGHALLVTAYAAVNLGLLFFQVDISSSSSSSAAPALVLGPLASRLGWLLIANMCVAVFFALKNTPLAYLSGHSYNRLGGLHQAAGAVTFVLLAAHAGTYTAFFYRRGKTAVLRERAQVAGIAAGCLMLVMVAAALLRRRVAAYELCYALHVGAFAADRLLRAARLAANSACNAAAVHALAGGGTRVVLARAPGRAAAGKHVFVWMPGLRLLEMHPLTIVAARRGGLEFVVASRGGFTRQLHAYAAAHPGARVWAACEGPYGACPDVQAYDTAVLVAGGSGASFTIGLAVAMLARASEAREAGEAGEACEAGVPKSLVFVWTAKTAEQLGWFGEHVAALQQHAGARRVHVSLHVTGAEAQTVAVEKATVTDTAEPGLPPMFVRGRPDAEAVIRAAVSSTAATQRVLVAACGPASLMATVRNATARCITRDGPSVELHCEQYG